MPIIKVHIDDPITPKKAETEHPTGNNATTTAPIQPQYPPARPGAVVAPGPTPYIPPQPTPTLTSTSTSTSNYGPPAPQPGAVPMPPGQHANVPPLSKAREAAAVESVPVTTMPPQMSMPTPNLNYLPTHSTTTAPTMNSSLENQGIGLTAVHLGAAPPPHPPGYQQNTLAQEMSSAARASFDAQEHGSGREMGLFGGLSGRDGAGGGVSGGMWDTVKGWANTAGKTLAETEKEVWKRINKE